MFGFWVCAAVYTVGPGVSDRCPGCGVLCATFDAEHLDDCAYQGRAALPLVTTRDMPYYPGVNCLHCGRFVGRDGWFSVEHWEMSSEIASLDGECGRCLAKDGA